MTLNLVPTINFYGFHFSKKKKKKKVKIMHYVAEY